MAKKEVAWEHRIQRKKNGEAYGSLHNVQLVLAHDKRWRKVLAFDEFIGDIITLKLPPWDKDVRPTHFKVGNWTDKDTSRVAVWLSRHHEINAATGVIEQALYVVADVFSRHPVRVWLQELKWDRTKRLDTMFIRLCGAPDTPYSREIAKNFLIGAIARIMEPGCQLDSMPILEGPQGAGKTSFFRNLFGLEWFLSSNIDITHKDGYQILQRKWCVEMGEMEALNNRQINDVKKYVSNPVDTYRPSYARRSQDFPRQSVFVGTTNDEHYLRDVTGARRFWPLEIQGVRLPDGSLGVDLVSLASEKLQLFAEAYVRYKKGEAWHITDPELKKEAAVVAEDKRQRDLWEVAIAQWIKRKKGKPEGRVFISRGLCTFDVLTMCFDKNPSDLTKNDEMRCASALKALGYTKGEKVSRYGGRLHVYRRPSQLHAASNGQEPEVGQEEVTKTRLVQPVPTSKHTSAVKKMDD